MMNTTEHPIPIRRGVVGDELVTIVMQRDDSMDQDGFMLDERDFDDPNLRQKLDQIVKVVTDWAMKNKR